MISPKIKISIAFVLNLGCLSGKALTILLSFVFLGSINPPSISSVSTEYLEGVPSKVTCEASYTCSKDAPVLTWNFANMPVDRDIKASGSLQKTVSTLTFTASAKDNGKSLICYAKFPGVQAQEKSMTIRVKREYQSQLKFLSFYQD